MVAKHAKFGLILDDFKLWWQWFSERMEISIQHRKKLRSMAAFLAFGEKSPIYFDPLTTKYGMSLNTLEHILISLHC